MTDHHEHRPPHDRQLDDARYGVRFALSALRSVDLPALPPDERTRLSRVAATLSDCSEELNR